MPGVGFPIWQARLEKKRASVEAGGAMVNRFEDHDVVMKSRVGTQWCAHKCDVAAT